MLKFKRKFTTTEKVVLVASTAVIVGCAIVARRRYHELIVNVAEVGVREWIEEFDARGMDVVILPKEITQKFVQAGMLAQTPQAA
jgi:hypothetical protein